MFDHAPHIPNPDDAAEELAIIHAMMAKGRKAASLDGWHLIVWGSLISGLLCLQHIADLADLAPGSRLWLWQPVCLIGFTASIFIGRRAAARRLSNPISRIYTTAFVSMFICLSLYMVAGSIRDRPDPYVMSLLYHGTMGGVFFTMGAATRLRPLLIAALGWWSGFCIFAWKGAIQVSDFPILYVSTLLFLTGPGVYLVWHKTHKSAG